MFFLAVVLLISPYCSNVESAEKQAPAAQQNAQKSAPLPTSKNQEIQNVKPKKPVKIRLHRNANGEYAWDITGDNADEICRADSRLKKLLKIEK